MYWLESGAHPDVRSGNPETCVGDEGEAAALSLAVDGEELLRATDAEDALTDGMVGIQIWDAPDSQEADPPRVEWDTFQVSEA